MNSDNVNEDEIAYALEEEMDEENREATAWRDGDPNEEEDIRKCEEQADEQRAEYFREIREMEEYEERNRDLQPERPPTPIPRQGEHDMHLDKGKEPEHMLDLHVNREATEEERPPSFIFHDEAWRRANIDGYAEEHPESRPLTPPLIIREAEPSSSSDEESNIGAPPDDNFRWRGRRYLLTYKHHLDKDALGDLITAHAKQTPSFFLAAHETGDRQCPYLHTHVVVEFKRSLNLRDSRRFDYLYRSDQEPNYMGSSTDEQIMLETLHPHVRSIPNAAGLQACVSYISKEDPECTEYNNQRNNESSQRSRNARRSTQLHSSSEHIDNVQQDGRRSATERAQPSKGDEIVEVIKTSDTLEDALRTLVERPSDAPGIIAMWRELHRAELRPPKQILPTRTWQEALLEEVDEICQDDRSIIWYYDPVGNTGKSVITGYLEDTQPGKWFCLSGTSSVREVTHQGLQAINSNSWNGFGFIYDITRTQEQIDGVYAVIELIKNGRWTSTKYMGGRAKMWSPWVIVFSNYLPNVKKLSKDRWDVRRIHSTYECETLTYEEVEALLPPPFRAMN